MSIKLVAIDLDETLLRKNKTYEIERFELALEQLTKKGVIVCIATGNSYHKFTEFFSPNAVEKLHFAGDNGNFIVLGHEVEKIIGVSRNTYLSIEDYFDQLDGYFICISTGEVTYLKEKSGPGFEKILRYNNTYQVLNSFSEIPENELATKIAIFSPRSLAKNKLIAKEVSNQFAEVSVVTSGDEWIDAYHYLGGKGSAIKFLQERFNITPSESMAFGDSLNDETMMHNVKYSIAMRNADVDLALHCSYVIGTNEEQAVIDILEQLVNDEQAEFMMNYMNKR